MCRKSRQDREKPRARLIGAYSSLDAVSAQCHGRRDLPQHDGPGGCVFAVMLHCHANHAPRILSARRLPPGSKIGVRRQGLGDDADRRILRERVRPVDLERFACDSSLAGRDDHRPPITGAEDRGHARGLQVELGHAVVFESQRNPPALGRGFDDPARAVRGEDVGLVSLRANRLDHQRGVARAPGADVRESALLIRSEVIEVAFDRDLHPSFTERDIGRHDLGAQLGVFIAFTGLSGVFDDQQARLIEDAQDSTALVARREAVPVALEPPLALDGRDAEVQESADLVGGATRTLEQHDGPRVPRALAAPVRSPPEALGPLGPRASAGAG